MQLICNSWTFHTTKVKFFLQKLSDKVVRLWQPNLNSNCQLVCVKSKVKVFLSTNDDDSNNNNNADLAL